MKAVAFRGRVKPDGTIMHCDVQLTPKRFGLSCSGLSLKWMQLCGSRRELLASWTGTVRPMPFMTRYRWGDVVLVAFPLSDMSGTRRRPGLVVYDSGDEDVMLARITQRPQPGTGRSFLTTTN